MWLGGLGSLATLTEAAGCGCGCTRVAAPVSVVFIVWLGSWAALGASRWGETERLQVALVRKCVSSLLKTRLHVGHFPRWLVAGSV